MEITARCAFAFHMEIGTSRDGSGPPIHRESIQGDLADLVDEAFVGAVLSEELPPDPPELHVRVCPDWSVEPRAEGVRVTLSTGTSDGASYVRRFETGRWMRRAKRLAISLRTEERLADDETAFVQVVAERQADKTLPLPVLLPPTVQDQSLESCGVRELGGGELCADRPVLVNDRMLAEILARTEQAGTNETGGSTLGKMVRLPEPLPGTTTRVVTMLTAAITDDRHTGELARFTFDPFALAEAGGIADLRGLGETVLTGFHSHGWGAECGRCNQSATCGLPEASHVSLSDYEVLESLFPSKATLMPIAGRKLGAAGDRPILEIHAWRGGRMESIPWRTYSD